MPGGKTAAARRGSRALRILGVNCRPAWKPGATVALIGVVFAIGIMSTSRRVDEIVRERMLGEPGMTWVEKCDRIVMFIYREAGQIEGIAMERDGGESTERINLFRSCLFGVWILSIIVTGLSCSYGLMSAGAHGGRIEIFSLLEMAFPNSVAWRVLLGLFLFSVGGFLVLLGAKVGRYENAASIEQLERLHRAIRVLIWLWGANVCIFLFLEFPYRLMRPFVYGTDAPLPFTSGALFETILYVLRTVFVSGLLLQIGRKCARMTPWKAVRSVFE